MPMKLAAIWLSEKPDAWDGVLSWLAAEVEVALDKLVTKVAEFSEGSAQEFLTKTGEVIGPAKLKGKMQEETTTTEGTSGFVGLPLLRCTSGLAFTAYGLTVCSGLTRSSEKGC